MIALLSRRYIQEYARRPINVVLLVVVPIIFVALAAGAIADFAGVVGGVADAGSLAAPTAGWAAAFVAGVGGFFQVLGSQGADRRLAADGARPRRVVFGRMLSGIGLAILAAASALVALAATSGLGDPVRTIAGTLMFALVYFAIGVIVASVVKDEVNGSLVVIFIWMLDVFLGPAMAGGDVWITRLFPSHFLTLVMLDASSGHAGPIGDLGWAAVWTIGSLVAATVVFIQSTAQPGITGSSRTTQRRDIRSGRDTRSRGSRITAGLRYGLRDYSRNLAMWVLFVVLPVFFITLSFVITPDNPTPVELSDGGISTIRILSMMDVHGAIMVPITIGFLAGLAGLFVVRGSLEADRRLALTGFRTHEILTARLGIIALASFLASGVSLAVTAIDFSAASWLWFAIGNVLVAITYALVGVAVGAMFGRLGGLYVMFLIPFIDIGIAQNVMFSASPPDWGLLLPGRGAMTILVDGAFTTSFDQTGAFLLATAWVVVLVALGSIIFRYSAKPRIT